MPEEVLSQKGANTSLIHVDWMIGSGGMDVHGVHFDGTEEPPDAEGRVGLIPCPPTR